MALALMVCKMKIDIICDSLLANSPATQLIGATVVNDLLALDNNVAPCTRWIGDYEGLLGVTFESINLDSATITH